MWFQSWTNSLNMTRIRRLLVSRVRADAAIKYCEK